MPKKTKPDAWRNRIIGHGEEAPDQLLANPANWRIHPKGQQDALSGVLSQVGWVQDVIVNRQTGHVVDGHLRVSLAISRQEPSIPVVYVDLSPEEEALVLATLDPLSAMAAADKDKLDTLLREVASSDAAVMGMLAELAKDAGLDYMQPAKEAPEAQIDRAAELQQKWQTERGQLWEIPSQSVPGKAHRLLCGDSTSAEDVGRLMDGEKADIAVSDPPYGVTKEQWDRPFEQVDLDGMLDISTGLVACFNAAKPLVLLAMLSLDPTPERVGVWRHSSITPKPGMIWSWQPVFYWRCGDANAWDSLDWYQGNADRDGTHPTQKPVAFFKKIVESVRCESVYDPFLGSGTTMVAAEQTGRLCYGMEIEPKYVAVALERLAAMGLQPVLTNSRDLAHAAH